MVSQEILLQLHEIDARLRGLKHKRERFALLGGLCRIRANLDGRCYKLLSNICRCVYHLNFTFVAFFNYDIKRQSFQTIPQKF